MRYVIVNESVEPFVAIPYDSEQECYLKFKELLCNFTYDILGFGSGDEEYDSIMNVKSLGELNNLEPIDSIMVLYEGDQGVWTGFSSADRTTSGSPLPLPIEDDFIGNGDPNFYFTVGQPDGAVVPVTKSVDDKGNVHPLYQKWLDHHPDGEGD